MKKEILNQLSPVQKLYNNYSQVIDQYEKGYTKLWLEIKEQIYLILSSPESFKSHYKDVVNENFNMFTALVSFCLSESETTYSGTLMNDVIKFVYLEKRSDEDRQLYWKFSDVAGSLTTDAEHDLSALMEMIETLHVVYDSISNETYNLQNKFYFFPKRNDLSMLAHKGTGLTESDWIAVNIH